MTLSTSPLLALRLATTAILVAFGQTPNGQSVRCNSTGCRSDLSNLTEKLHTLAGRDHSSFNLETGKGSSSVSWCHTSTQNPSPEPAAPELLDPGDRLDPVDPVGPREPKCGDY
jgi:hypothetical protein